MTNIYHQLNQAHIILVAAPLYFNTVPAQLKALIDRCQALWASKYILQDSLIDRQQQRLGAFISTAGQPKTKNRFKYVIGTMDLFFKAVNATYYDNFLVGNIDQKPINKRPQILNQAQSWGEKIAQELQ